MSAEYRQEAFTVSDLFSKAKKYRPSPSGLTVIRLLLIIISVAAVIVSKVYLSAYPIIMYSVIGLFCFGSFALGMILLPIVFAKSYYVISDSEIHKTSGMFIITRQYMKADSIQYVTVVTTPLSSLTGLNFVFVNALGGRMIMLFLSKSDALEISAALNEIIRRNGNGGRNG